VEEITTVQIDDLYLTSANKIKVSILSPQYPKPVELYGTYEPSATNFGNHFTTYKEASTLLKDNTRKKINALVQQKRMSTELIDKEIARLKTIIQDENNK